MKVLGYAPDLDPITDGILLDCEHVVPTVRGIAAAPQPVETDITANAASAVIGAATLIKLNGDLRTFYGSDSKLYELVSAGWSDVSGSTGYVPVNGRWRFAQYGNVSLSISKENVLRASATGDFTAVVSVATGSTVTAPSASLIEVVNDFIFLADTTDIPGFAADEADRWICSARGDYSDYTPRVSVECVTGRLTSVPGKITAIRKFGDQVVVYKQRGMYLGNNVGPPIVWAFPELPTSNQGTWCQESVISLSTPEQPLHFFVGRDDFYLFDGARPLPVGHGVKETFFALLNTEHADQITLTLDRTNSRVYIFAPLGGSTVCNSCLVFNYRTRKWGLDNRSISFAFEYAGGSVAYSGLGGYLSNILGFQATYGNLATLGLTYGTLATRPANLLPAFFDTNNILYTLTGVAGPSSFTPSDYGTDEYSSMVQRVQPRYIVKPSSGSLDNYAWDNSGDSPGLVTTTQMNNQDNVGAFDFVYSSMWHRFKFSYQGDWEMNEIKVTSRTDGVE